MPDSETDDSLNADEVPARTAHLFPGAPETVALIGELSSEGGDLATRAATAIRMLDERLAELEETLKFVAENGKHFLLLTNCEEHVELAERYQELLRKSRKLGEVEIDDGSLTFRSGSLSITVAAETATVYDTGRGIPARRVRLGHESFFEDADDFLRPD